MRVVQFIENNSVVLCQLLRQIPAVDENIKIKGKKGKVVSVKDEEEKLVQVHIEFEKVVKKPLVKDTKNKKR